MIELTRENGHALFVNPDLIETAQRDEEGRLTLVVMSTGNTLVVREDGATIAERVVAYRRRCAPGNA